MNPVVRSSEWATALRRLDAAGIRVLLAAGRREPVPLPDLAASLAAGRPHGLVAEPPRDGHDLALSDPGWRVDRLPPGRVPAPPAAR